MAELGKGTSNPNVNKHAFTYHGQETTGKFRYRKAHNIRATRTLRATQVEQGVAGSRWIGRHKRTEVSHPHQSVHHSAGVIGRG